MNSFTWSLLIGLIVAVYGAFFYVPHWWPIFRLQSVMRGICNEMNNEFNNTVLMEKLLREGARTGLRLTEENFKLERIMPEVDELTGNEAQDNLLRVRGKSCKLQAIYETSARLPLLPHSVPLRFHRIVKEPLGPVKYDTFSCGS